MQKWKRRGRPECDVFDLLDMNPVEEYKVCCFSLQLRNRDNGNTDGCAEFCDHERIYDAYGEDNGFYGDRPEESQSKEDCEGYKEEYWAGVDAECASASGDTL